MKKTSFLLICYIISTVLCAGQTVTVNGIVMDDRKNRIGQATISVVGKNISATSDDDGNFVLESSNWSKGELIILRASKKGYGVSTKEITVSSLPTSIFLKEDPIASKMDYGLPPQSQAHSTLLIQWKKRM